VTPNRREFLKQAASLAVSTAVSGNLTSAAYLPEPVPSGAAQNSRTFPQGFLWGAATAAHQVEGNNVSSDLWLVEHLKGSMFKEPSGDACDHYHLYEQDLDLLSGLGLNAYRFSVEWARIEPEQGYFSRAELDHYRRMLEACHRLKLTPLVTYSHFSVPRWFAYLGAWENPDSSNLFARYCEQATRHLGDLIAYAATFNEPDVPHLIRWMTLPNVAPGASLAERMAAGNGELRKQLNAPQFSTFLFGDPEKTQQNMTAAHEKGKAAVKSVKSSLPVGLTLAIEDDQSAGPGSQMEKKRAEAYGPWLQLAKKDDYIGVQTYTRARVATKNLPPAANAELTQMGYEFYPESLEHTVRYASKETGVPVLVTENGVATDDDEKRIEYIRRAVRGVKRCIDSGIDVRGYVYWSLLDNFEWVFGYAPKFGLIAVDRETQKRTVKPSATVLGKIARENSI
jgi:beta-glucosidase